MFSSTQLFICGIVILVIGYLVIYGSSSKGFREGIDVACNNKTKGLWHNAKCSSSGRNLICDPKGSVEHGACVDAGIPWIPNTTGRFTYGAGQQQCKTCGKCGPGLDWFKSWKKDPAAPGLVAEICTPTCSKLATMGLCGEDWVLNDDGGFCTADSRWSANCGVGDCQKCGKCRSGKQNADGTCPPHPLTCSTFLGENNCPSGTTSKSANAVCNSSAGANGIPGWIIAANTGKVGVYGGSGFSCSGSKDTPHTPTGSYSTCGAFTGDCCGPEDNDVPNDWCEQNVTLTECYKAAKGTADQQCAMFGVNDGNEPYTGTVTSVSCGAAGSVDKPGESGGCSAQGCCTPNPQCSSLKGCPDKTTLTSPSQVCAGPVCSTDECCPPNPVCASSICNAQTQVFTGSGVRCNEATCTSGECCTDRAQCNSITCDSSKYDSQPADTYCAGTTCSVSECCIPDPTCAGYNCPVGTYHPKQNQAGIKCGVNESCTTDECCDLNPTCAGFSPCPTHEHLKETAANIRCKTATCNSTECCGWNPKCSTHTCLEDDFYWSYAHIPNASGVFCNTEVCTDNQCCVATPTGNLPKVQTYPLFTQ